MQRFSSKLKYMARLDCIFQYQDFRKTDKTRKLRKRNNNLEGILPYLRVDFKSQNRALKDYFSYVQIRLLNLSRSEPTSVKWFSQTASYIRNWSHRPVGNITKPHLNRSIDITRNTPQTSHQLMNRCLLYAYTCKHQYSLNMRWGINTRPSKVVDVSEAIGEFRKLAAIASKANRCGNNLKARWERKNTA